MKTLASFYTKFAKCHATGALGARPLRGVASAAGLIFVAAGLFKLAMPQLAKGATFGGFLHLLHVPGAGFWGIAVPLVEVACGAALFTRWQRQAAVPLAIDMAVAVFTVGWPGFCGHPILYAGERVGAEPWRLPLELVLLVVLLLAIVRPRRSGEA